MQLHSLSNVEAMLTVAGYNLGMKRRKRKTYMSVAQRYLTRSVCIRVLRFSGQTTWHH